MKKLLFVALTGLMLQVNWAGAQELVTGDLLNNSDDRVSCTVEKVPENSPQSKQATFVLKMRQGMWWKAIVLNSMVSGKEASKIFEIRTGDHGLEATISVEEDDLTPHVMFILAKGGSSRSPV